MSFTRNSSKIANLATPWVVLHSCRVIYILLTNCLFRFKVKPLTIWTGMHFIRFIKFGCRLVFCCTHARYVVVRADALGEQSVPDFPGENGRALPLKLGDFADHLRCGHSRFTSSNRAWSNRACLVVPAQDLTHTSVGHLDTKRETQITHII